MKELVKEEVVAGLKCGVATVRFIKRDGSERTMLATLDPLWLPDPTETSSREPNDEVVSCWDIEANGWRSFRLDSVVSIEFTPGEDYRS